MTENKVEVFCLTDLNGRLLPPSIQATVLAKYSRSPSSAKSILSELTEEDADKFQDKWVISYNHSSVAELTAIPVCFEGVSIVASKFLENYPRMGFSEKSTRYQSFSRDSFVTPPGASSTMQRFASRFYDAYDRLYPKVIKHIVKLVGKDPNDPKNLEDRTIKARAFDNVRYLLPAGTGTSLAAEGNLRDFRYMIQDARGHTNPEIRMLGEKIHTAISEICPVLVKSAEPDSFEPQIRSLGQLPNVFNFNNPNWYVNLHRSHLFPNSALVQSSFESVVADRYGMSWTNFCKHMEGRGKKQIPKIFRTVRLSFDIMMDYGAYRDLQRHRRCDQTPEYLTPNYGYVVPDDILGTEMESEYREVMESITSYDDENVIHDPDLIQYMVPLGYLHRSIFDMDLQELYYISELRTQPQGHISYRRVAYEMFRIAAERMPQLMQWCRAVQPNSIGIHTLQF